MPSVNPYTAQTIPSTYNATPPPDDGSQTSANRVEWQKHLDKIGNPLRSFGQNIDSEVNTTFGNQAMGTDPGEETVVIALRMFG